MTPKLIFVSFAVVPILTPGVVEGISTVAGAASAADAYLPDLGFWADLGNLMLSGSSLSPMVRLSRDVLESQQCAEYVSCQLSHFSRNYSPLQFLHRWVDKVGRLRLSLPNSSQFPVFFKIFHSGEIWRIGLKWGRSDLSKWVQGV